MISSSVIRLNLKMRKSLLVGIIILILIITSQITSPVLAQDTTPTAPVSATQSAIGPIYIVQEGDSLTLIANRFGIKMSDLMAANGISDADQLNIGQSLTIPGLEGINGYLITEKVNYGDTLKSLSRQHQTPEFLLRRLNKITSPSELFAGIGLVLLKPTGESSPLTARTSLSPGESLLELAVRQQANPWTISGINYLDGTWDGIPNEVLYASTITSGEATNGGLPTALKNVDVSIPITQGETATITVTTDPGVKLEGMLVDKPLRFFSEEDGTQVALQGVHAMLPPGPYPLRLEATLPDGSTQAFEQNILVRSGNYPKEALKVDPSYVDPAVTEPENIQLFSIVEPATPEKYWNGLFSAPSVYPDCFTSWFGSRRSYNDSEYIYFHSGVDFCGGEGLQIFAPADGVVIFAGPLTVRGNATIIDHGHGVYSGIWHQSEILVSVGEKVTKGQEIGLVGGTGRVTGAHLHWEVIVNGIQVNPEDWLAKVYP
jgi:murein DD-endopeptidase MepM/ murein hydrolase activator NlpD